MTRMLASVASEAEAKTVLRTNVDIIDIKNPRAGALGAQPCETVRAIVDAVQRQKLTSATIGDVAQCDPELPRYIDAMAATGVDIVKVGLFDQQPDPVFIRELANSVSNHIRLVVVLFAEYFPFAPYLPALLDTGVGGVMIDTCTKDGRSLRQHLDAPALEQFISEVRSHGRMAGLAGSLHCNDIDPLLSLKPDYLGFRGALCRASDRTARLDEQLVNSICQAVHKDSDFRYDATIIQQAS